MFKSIRWKFITIYFLLVFIAMVIVGVFIVEKFQENLENQITKNMESLIKTLFQISSAISSDDWGKVKDEIKGTVTQLSIDSSEKLYIIYNSKIPDMPEIIAADRSNESNFDNIIGKNAYEYGVLREDIIYNALKGEKIIKNDKVNMIKHLAYPVENEVGQVKGIIYVTSKLNDMHNTLNDSKEILTSATFLALLITVLLGFFIANSITGPIKDVTVKAASMAKGNFDQVVEVKSSDEIGQLASMFNYLTLKLKKTMSEVYREKSKLDTIFKYMADGVIAVNVNGDIIHANIVAMKILNITEEDINIKKYDEVFVNYNPKLTLQYIQRVNRWKGSHLIEIASSVYRVKFASFRNKNNEIGGLIIVLQDVTEQQKLENMRKEFVANVSHELKTPITTIKSYAETLIENGLDNEKLSYQFLDVINSECDRMDRIVKDLLQLSNLDYKQTKWNKTSLCVEELLKDSFFKMKISADEKMQSLNLTIKEEMPNVVGDKDRLEQVILNVISNAIKYTPVSGKIDIFARLDNDNVIITVKDNGIGIPENDIGRIFERFYRVDKARSRELGGTGLGLSIAKQIVEHHGGNIKIRSKYKIGTEVDIILPVQLSTVIQF